MTPLHPFHRHEVTRFAIPAGGHQTLSAEDLEAELALEEVWRGVRRTLLPALCSHSLDTRLRSSVCAPKLLPSSPPPVRCARRRARQVAASSPRAGSPTATLRCPPPRLPFAWVTGQLEGPTAACFSDRRLLLLPPRSDVLADCPYLYFCQQVVCEMRPLLRAAAALGPPIYNETQPWPPQPSALAASSPALASWLSLAVDHRREVGANRCPNAFGPPCSSRRRPRIAKSFGALAVPTISNHISNHSSNVP